MAAFFQSGKTIKFGTYSMKTDPDKMPLTFRAPLGNVIKFFQAPMGLAEKAKLGLLTYPEYLEYEEMLKLKEQEENGEEIVFEDSEEASPKAPRKNQTFWQNDESERKNMSSDDYSDFLSQNNVDVTNSTAVNFDELAKSLEYAGSSPAE